MGVLPVSDHTTQEGRGEGPQEMEGRTGGEQAKQGVLRIVESHETNRFLYVTFSWMDNCVLLTNWDV